MCSQQSLLTSNLEEQVTCRSNSSATAHHKRTVSVNDSKSFNCVSDETTLKVACAEFVDVSSFELNADNIELVVVLGTTHVANTGHRKVDMEHNDYIPVEGQAPGLPPSTTHGY